MDAFSRAIIGYRVSDSRAVGHCILAMRMAFNKLKELPKAFKFIADGYVTVKPSGDLPPSPPPRYNTPIGHQARKKPCKKT
jgi:hypothetical protein